jgi:hypothetical protein
MRRPYKRSWGMVDKKDIEDSESFPFSVSSVFSVMHEMEHLIQNVFHQSR